MSNTDLELLARYTRHRAEDAFAEIVRRHLALVHSAALRQVRSPQLAEEVAQSTFLKLAHHARQLASDTILSAWLYQVTRREAIDVVRREARRQMREQIATEMNAMNATAADWTHIEPLLDEAMHALDETDRAAVLLRYFENKSLREVGQALGASENAAQKRLTRAVEQLREFFAQGGVTVGASGLAVVISANAVQAAPVGLAITISTAAALAGTTIVTTTTATAAKIIAMTTLQKTLVATTLIAAVGTGIYEARQAAGWRQRAVELHDQDGDQIQQAQRERDEAVRQLAALRSAQPRTDSNAELLRLRGEVGMLRRENQSLSRAKNSPPKTEQTQTLNKGFGALGEYLTPERISDAGNSSAEALLQTFIWAVREGKVERLGQIGAPFGGQNEPGEVVGFLPKSEAEAFRMVQKAFTNSAGFRLSSRRAQDGQTYQVRLEADPLPGSLDDFTKNMNLTFYLEQKADRWSFGNPVDESTPKPE